MTRLAAIIGGGVIGAGWAARFLLNGWNVRVFDPDPEAARKISEVLDNARRALPGLGDVTLPPEGEMRFCATIAEAVSGALWVQESVSERLDLKHRVLAEIESAADAQAIIGSSTSGFKPSELQQGALHPGRIMVAHPFNPVYLLPLVELVPGDQGDEARIAAAKATLRDIGMYPLHIRKEIDAHIADRLLESVWREALWLIKDEIATTEDIDNAIHYGFGLRWAQMGLFETYRVAGGEAGMKHFIAQFGPCLSWPWSKLTDVPVLDDTLVNAIADQSDAQSGGHSIRALERIRDKNLVGILRALAAENWGAGALQNDRDRTREPEAGLARRAEDIEDFSRPVLTVNRVVPLDWLDYNGHMTEARYLHAFGNATDRFMEIIGCDADYIASGGSFFTAETHIRHLDEVHAGHGLQITTRVLMAEGKKMHLWHEMHSGERLLATGEHMLLHVDLATRRAAPPSGGIAANLARIAEAQAELPRPDGAGRGVGMAR